MKRIAAMLLAIVMMCAAFGAFAEEAQAPSFATIGEAAEVMLAAAEEFGREYFYAEENYVTVIVAQADRFFRVVGELDETAKEMLASADEYEEYEAANEYCKTLPVAYIEELTAKRLEQAELDAMIGKTVTELEEEGFIVESYGTMEEGIGVTFISGLYNYDALLDIDEETYYETSEVGDGKVLSVEFIGPAGRALDLRFHADGTVDPELEAAENGDFSFEDDPVLQAVMGALAAAQNGEEVDWNALLEQLIELVPDKADEIRGLLELIPGLNGNEEAVPAE
ncbi:MAG: hypothetical protein IJM56_02720 [Clostridia bacterium]|nr:hypothetical protein [Clostridia bacterium]